jgi:hypothetical protein
MFVLFDQGTPVPMCPFLKEHTVSTNRSAECPFQLLQFRTLGPARGLLPLLPPLLPSFG